MNELLGVALIEEQQHLDQSYALLDARTDDARRQLSEYAGRKTSHAQNRLEIESLSKRLVRRIAAYDAAQRRLCFGRIDTIEGERFHIGRIGLADDARSLVQIDWRAPVAAAFYQATAASPAGLVLRRHLSCDGRTVTAVSDDVFDNDAVGDGAVLSADAVLMAALSKQRTGKMGDIVATIQAEQDAIVRSAHPGILVVDGGPGTGKTVVALHRAAYLLYRDRDRLERSGVLILGPSSRFLSYIDEVLPGLGETGVVLATVADLFPGVEATRREHLRTQQVKADLKMARVIERAVHQIRRFPTGGVTIELGSERVHLGEQFIQSAAKRALRDDPRHNVARPLFISAVVEQLISLIAQRRGLDAGDRSTRQDLFEEIDQTASARRAINLLWMPWIPERLITALWAQPDRLRRAADRILTDEEQAVLYRPAGSSWGVADVALLDEAAELLGPDLSGAPRVVDVTDEHGETSELSSESDYLDDLVDRALADREWCYGHIIVDEAQELTPMQWRMISRHVPSRSMTVVGDPDQSSTPGACADWAEALDPIAPGRWVRATLSVNYRTPQAICDLAGTYRAEHGSATPMLSVRDNGVAPLFSRVESPADLAGAVVSATATTPGLTVVIAPKHLVSQLTRVLAIPVIDATEAKGLEFDHVVVVEPATIEADAGIAGLYVALTRATSSLTIVHHQPLPSGLAAR